MESKAIWDVKQVLIKFTSPSPFHVYVSQSSLDLDCRPRSPPRERMLGGIKL